MPGRISTEENAARRRLGGAAPTKLPGVTTRSLAQSATRRLAWAPRAGSMNCGEVSGIEA